MKLIETYYKTDCHKCKEKQTILRGSIEGDKTRKSIYFICDYCGVLNKLNIVLGSTVMESK